MLDIIHNKRRKSRKTLSNFKAGRKPVFSFIERTVANWVVILYVVRAFITKKNSKGRFSLFGNQKTKASCFWGYLVAVCGRDKSTLEVRCLFFISFSFFL